MCILSLSLSSLLEESYEDLGDTLAVQYGGSQLVHRYTHTCTMEPLNNRHIGTDHFISYI